MKTNGETARDFARILLKSGAVKINAESPFTWASGRKAPIYCNNRSLLCYRGNDFSERDEIVEMLINTAEDMLSREDFAIAGVATGAIPWASMLAFMGDYPLGYVMSKPKDHGANSDKAAPKSEQEILAAQVVGGFDVPVIVVEDLISTGGSSLQAVKALQAKGCQVVGMVALFSYGLDEAQKLFEEAGVEVVTLSDYSTLIEVAVEEDFIGEEYFDVLKEWRKDPKAWSDARQKQ